MLAARRAATCEYPNKLSKSTGHTASRHLFPCDCSVLQLWARKLDWSHDGQVQLSSVSEQTLADKGPFYCQVAWLSLTLNSWLLGQQDSIRPNQKVIVVSNDLCNGVDVVGLAWAFSLDL